MKGYRVDRMRRRWSHMFARLGDENSRGRKESERIDGKNSVLVGSLVGARGCLDLRNTRFVKDRC